MLTKAVAGLSLSFPSRYYLTNVTKDFLCSHYVNQGSLRSVTVASPLGSI